MNENIKRAIINNAIKPFLSDRIHNTTGTILKTYYNERGEEPENLNYNAADVEILEKNTGTKQTIGMVPIVMNGVLGGVDGARLKIGDTVVISFQGGNGNYPRIMGKVYKDSIERNLEMKADKGNTTGDFFAEGG